MTVMEAELVSIHNPACPWVGVQRLAPCYECGLLSVGVAQGRIAAGEDIRGFSAAAQAGAVGSTFDPAVLGGAVAERMQWYHAGLSVASVVAERGYYRG